MPGADAARAVPARPPVIAVSVISHGHGPLVHDLLSDLGRTVAGEVEVLLTLNIPESLPFPSHAFPFPLRIVENGNPQGFGANHNHAFGLARAPFFCVLNPDVRLRGNPFTVLAKVLEDRSVSVVAPLVRNPANVVEDSARRFPTVASLIAKALRARSAPDYAVAEKPLEVDWVAGMFMLFRREVYASVGGFDQRYFLYYEDVDLCARLRARGGRVVLVPEACVTHDARRASHRDLRHAVWHARSMARYFRRRWSGYR